MRAPPSSPAHMLCGDDNLIRGVRLTRNLGVGVRQTQITDGVLASRRGLCEASRSRDLCVRQ